MMMRDALPFRVCHRFAKNVAVAFTALLLPVPLAMGFTQSDDPQPTSIADAVRIIDLRTWSLAPGAKPPSNRNLTTLYYEAGGKVSEIFEQQCKQLSEKGWEEMPGGYRSDQSSSAAFKNQGHVVSLSVSDSGKPGIVSVMISNHGNVDLKTLPVPEGTKPFYNAPSVVSYVTETPVDQTAKACRELLLARGWLPYGDAANQHFFKKNGVRLSAFIQSAPAQGGKTVINYSTELLSADLPAHPEAKGLQYSGNQILFDISSSRSEIVDFYRNMLGKAGWEPTLKQLTKSGFRDFMIFRNPQKEMLTLEVYDVANVLRVSLKYETAEEVAAMQRKFEEQVARKKMEKKKKDPIVRISVPEGAKEIEQSKSRIEFKLDSGQAKAVVESLRKALTDDGWNAKIVILNDRAGAVSLEKGDQDLTISYTDTGFFSAEVSVHAIRAELERVPEKK